MNDSRTKKKYNNYIEARTDYIKLINYKIGGASVKKWTTLQHYGVMFYPEYEPHEVPIKYGSEKTSIVLNHEAEEFITYYVQSRFDKYRTEKFNKNFFKDLKTLLSPELRTKIVNFSLCDLSDVKKHVDMISEQKKEVRSKLSKEDRENEKNINDKKKEKYSFAIVDGINQTIDNFLVEPPTIFVGRGAHPLSGSIKKRLYPEDITLNIGKDMNIPVPYIFDKKDDRDGSVTEKTRWGSIISDNTLEWIASWQNNVTHKYNYARFGRKSGFKMKSDENKYDKARILKRKIKAIRENNMINMISTNMEIRQLSTALYLIDKLALRVGNEKKEDEADTVGVTTLKIKNVHLLENNVLKLDFLGKDSIRYINKIQIPEVVYKNIKEFHNYNSSAKGNNDELFNLVNSDTLNRYIKLFMNNLTSKVFRTFNASQLMQIELKKISEKYKSYDKHDKLEKIHHEYEMANLKVAKLCNHQKVALKSSGEKIEKKQMIIHELKKKLRELKQKKTKHIEQGKKTAIINKKITNLQHKIKSINIKKTLQSESKTLSAGTSKINYIDPRITIAFLKTNNLMEYLDKFFKKTHQKQFEWAIDVDKSYRF